MIVNKEELFFAGLNRINSDCWYPTDMECAVYDTYVTKKDGKTMHFDVIVESSTPHEKAIEYGKEYLKDAGQDGQSMTQEECQFCHVQEAPKIVEDSIQKSGYFIQRMEGCP
jgi:hypothetical protein